MAGRPADSETSSGSERVLLDEQIAYYRARAGEYDRWFLRQGRYDRGEENNRRWLEEAARLRHVVAATAELLSPGDRILELACGTGLWSDLLAAGKAELTAVDASPEMIARCRQRLGDRSGDADVRFIEADLFEFQPQSRFDLVFFGFWLSHVPAGRWRDFWTMVREASAPRGRLLFVDSLYEPTSTARDHQLGERAAATSRRRLDDGREFTIVKRFYDPAALGAELGRGGWRGEVQTTGRYFLYGSFERARTLGSEA